MADSAILVETTILVDKRYVEADFNRIIEIREREDHRVNVFMEQIICRST
jgi:type I restriction enzyme R subunit